MSNDRFEAWCLRQALRGQRELAETLKVLVYKRDAEFFETLDYDDEDAFLNPLLFAWFTSGAEPGSLREIFSGNGAAASLLTPASPHEPLPVFTCGHALLDRFFTDGEGRRITPLIEPVVAARSGQLHRALRLIRTHCPELAVAIFACTRGVMLFRAPSPHSFAALSAHGIVFLNIPEHATEVHFLEDLAHQCAHVLCNAMTLDKQRYLAVDPDATLADVLDASADTRPVYTVFHALFTYAWICRVLSTLRERAVFAGRRRHELEGRLAFTLTKFRTDIDLLAPGALYTARGRLVYRRLARQLALYAARDGELLHRFDLSNQPYNFSYERFAERNRLVDSLEVAA